MLPNSIKIGLNFYANIYKEIWFKGNTSNVNGGYVFIVKWSDFCFLFLVRYDLQNFYNEYSKKSPLSLFKIEKKNSNGNCHEEWKSAVSRIENKNQV